MRVLSILALGALIASPALADPVKLSVNDMDAVTAGTQTGTPFGTTVVVPALGGGGTDNKGFVSSAAQRNDGHPGLGDTQTGQIDNSNIKGEAKANGL